MTLDRAAEVGERLGEVEERIAQACRAAGRDRGEVALIAITKTYPADDVRVLAELGVRHVGENRDQEAAGKARECAGLPLTWHFVGQLQTNKAKSVVGYADVIHSVDRSRLITAISRAAVNAGREVTCLVQVALDDDPERGGARAADVPGLADEIATAEGIRLGGVMAVAPLGEDPGKAFARLREIALAMQRRHPGATMISAGMSGDLSEAVRPRRDTRAGRYGVARPPQALRQVMSPQVGLSRGRSAVSSKGVRLPPRVPARASATMSRRTT